jgi:hypothetical protein
LVLFRHPPTEQDDLALYKLLPWCRQSPFWREILEERIEAHRNDMGAVFRLFGRRAVLPDLYEAVSQRHLEHWVALRAKHHREDFRNGAERLLRQYLTPSFSPDVYAAAVFRYVRDEQGSRTLRQQLAKSLDCNERQLLEMLEDLLGPRGSFGVRKQGA